MRKVLFATLLLSAAFPAHADAGAWEAEARRVETAGLRWVTMRTGIVLTAHPTFDTTRRN